MIILTGGKTGGHIMPLIALSKRLGDVLYIGSKNSLEERICKENKVPFKGLDIKNNIFNLISNSYKLNINNIKCIISTGGFVSTPVLLYGIIHRIPIYLIEGNVIIGKVNKWVSKFSKKIFTAYKISDNKKYIVTGLPVMVSNNDVKIEYDILIIGGSLGSKPLCDLVYSLNINYRICLISGRFYNDYLNINNVTNIEYSNNLIELMRKSRLVISRAGAMTTYEIFKINKPCIIIPSKKTKNNHQYINAKYFEKYKLCLYLDEIEASNLINNTVAKMLSSEALIINMKKNQFEITNHDSVKLILENIDELR